MTNEKEFEAALLKKLTASGADKAALKLASASIVELAKNGLVIDQVFVKGIPARLDRYIINGIVDPDFFRRFNFNKFNLRRFEIFPYGILNPEGLKFKAEIRF
jgi:hypothetical protein